MSADPYDWRRPAPARPYAEVIGDPIAQSKSPAIHTFWLGKLGIDAEYRAAHVRVEDLADYLNARRADPNWRGCNVTMPHKQAVMDLLDGIDALVRRIGAVNTIIPNWQGMGLAGFNTDALGFFEPLEQAGFRFDPQARILMLGNGGAARAILVRLDDARASVVPAGRDQTSSALTLSVRDRAKGQALLNELTAGRGYAVADLADYARPASADAPRFDLVVNASPLGMKGNPELNFDLTHVASGGTVYDIVTAPLDTDLLQRARAVDGNVKTIDGLAMLIGQARYAFELFFERELAGRKPSHGWDLELRERLLA